jgi:hypothetical protein
MQQLRGKIEGPFSVEEDSSLQGMITGGTLVRQGVLFHLHGTIVGDLTVEDGARAIVHGTVNGTIHNYGDVTIYGTIDALANRGPASRSVVDERAIIRNSKQ